MASGILGISLMGLTAAQSNLSTTSQNIANVNTDGYHRQATNLATATPITAGSTTLGNGVDVVGVGRAYSSFLDNQVTSSQTQLSSYETYSQYATQLNSLTGGQNSTFSTSLANFFSSIQNVANDPTSTIARQDMLTSGNTLAGQFNNISSALGDIQQSVNQQIQSISTQVTYYAKSIATLNTQITSAQATNSTNANDLLDKRDQLVAEMNKLVNVSVVNQPGSGYSLYIGNGLPIVQGGVANGMTSLPNPSDPTQTIPALQIGSTSVPLDSTQISGGQLGGLLSFRSQMLSPSQTQLNNLASTLTTQINTQSALGYDLNGTQGTDFFTLSGSTLSVAISDPSKIAAAGEGASTGVSAGRGDNSNALAMADLQTSKLMPNSSTLQAAFNQLVGQNASLTNAATLNQQTYQALTTQATQAQQSFSGVNLDEEAANLIQYQQAYQAAAKAMQVASSLFSTILTAIQ
jgi:flagellar hook-associated protein 1 FlgK